MHKFIPTHWNRNTHILVTKYTWPIEEYLKGHAILVHINCLEDISNIKRHLHETTKVHAFVYTDKYASLETIEINPDWGNTPIILYINRLGQFRNIHQKIALIKNMNIILIFTGQEEQATTDAQIAASLGIHTGIVLSPQAHLSDCVLDLMTYNFYNTMPHAEIEPFSTIGRYYDGESYVSPKLAEFINPLRYIYVDKDLHLAFSQKELDEGTFFDQGLEKLYEVSSHETIEKEACKWQEMFIEPHPCTFCPAFRICMGYFSEQRESGRCREVMNELLGAIEFNKKKQQKKEICQL
nr:hypothetical protein [Prevotella sp.]